MRYLFSAKSVLAISIAAALVACQPASDPQNNSANTSGDKIGNGAPASVAEVQATAQSESERLNQWFEQKLNIWPIYCQSSSAVEHPAQNKNTGIAYEQSASSSHCRRSLWPAIVNSGGC